MASIKVKVVSNNGMQRLEKAIKDLDGLSLKVGWFSTNVYENGTPVAGVAAIQEFGVPEKNIPARPFMRPTVEEKKDSWANLANSGARAIIAGNETAESVFEKMGFRIRGDIQKKIASVYQPPLKPATVLARLRRAGVLTKPLAKRYRDYRDKLQKLSAEDVKVIGNSEKPLVDTRIMIDSITSVVEKK